MNRQDPLDTAIALSPESQDQLGMTGAELSRLVFQRIAEGSLAEEGITTPSKAQIEMRATQLAANIRAGMSNTPIPFIIPMPSRPMSGVTKREIFLRHPREGGDPS